MQDMKNYRFCGLFQTATKMELLVIEVVLCVMLIALGQPASSRKFRFNYKVYVNIHEQRGGGGEREEARGSWGTTGPSLF